MIKINKLNFTALQILSTGFAMVILIGALLLMTPLANRNGIGLSFINALFTSASATCVTGLIINDTYTQFTLFGQLVILCLIQIGALGFMAIALFFSMVMGKRIGLRERSLMVESIGALKIGGIIRLVRRVLLGTMFIELCGAVLLALRFCPRFGLIVGIWYGVFHSVSAFCNAGFDLMGRIAPGSSLTVFAGDVVVNVVIMSLIVIGGIGFVVWDDLTDHTWHFKKYRLQTKIVFSTTFFLILGGAALMLFFEYNHAFVDMTWKEKILASFFQSVTPRTAGFNTVHMDTLSESGTALTMILMFIGASPGSTGGGIKTTAFFVIMFSVISFVRKRDGINVFHRKVEDGAVERAYNSATLYVVAALIGTLLICYQGLNLEAVFFEVLSAIGTVGLSKGITGQLSVGSKAVIIVLMYIGRVGSLSVAMAVSERRIKSKVNNIEEKIITG